MASQCDQSTPIHAKETIVLDKDGNTIFAENHYRHSRNTTADFQDYSGYFKSKNKGFQLKGGAAILAGAAFVIALTMGTLFIGGILSALAAIWLVHRAFSWVLSIFKS